jgi:hypothetical protein
MVLCIPALGRATPECGRLHYLDVRDALELGVSTGAVERAEQAS